jgi:hypothetical protein
MSLDSIERRLFALERGIAGLDLRGLERRATAEAGNLREATMARDNLSKAEYSPIISNGTSATNTGNITISVVGPFNETPPNYGGSAPLFAIELYADGGLVAHGPPGAFSNLFYTYIGHALPTLPSRYLDVWQYPVTSPGSPYAFPVPARNSTDTVFWKYFGPMPPTLKMDGAFFSGASVQSGLVLTFSSSKSCWLGSFTYSGTLYYVALSTLDSTGFPGSPGCPMFAFVPGSTTVIDPWNTPQVTITGPSHVGTVRYRSAWSAYYTSLQAYPFVAPLANGSDSESGLYPIDWTGLKVYE